METRFDLQELFYKSFGTKPYMISGTFDQQTENSLFKNTDKLQSPMASTLREWVNGVEVWFPTKFFNAGSSMGDIPIAYLPYSVVRIYCKHTIVKTPLMSRKGTVKEMYNTDDYNISIKGFLLGDKGQFPEADIDNFKDLFELRRAIKLDNAITNIFLTGYGLDPNEQQRVVIESIDFPAVEGGKINVKPFSMGL